MMISSDIMSEQKRLILPVKEVSAAGSRYSIKKPSKKKWILNVAIFLAFYAIWYVSIAYTNWDIKPTPEDRRTLIISLVVISVVSPVIAVFLWNWIGRWVTKKLVFQTLKIKYEQESEIRGMLEDLKKDTKYKRFKFFRVVFTSLLNIDIDPETHYFLEEETSDSDVSSIRVFLKTRMYDLITSSLSISILIAMIIQLSRPSSFFVGFMIGAFVILCSPILTAWITPVVWSIEDTRIKFIRKNNDVYQLSERMRRSVLHRFFSLSAFITGIIFFSDLFEGFFGDTITIRESILLFLMSIGVLLIVIILLSGTSFLVGTLYLTVFHEKNVNEFRDRLSDFLKFAQANAVYSKYYEEELSQKSG